MRRRNYVVLALLLLGLQYDHGIQIFPVQAVTWSAPSKLTPSLTIETRPYVAENGSGALWTVWESYRFSNWDLYGRWFDGVSWLAEERLTNHTARDQTPAWVQVADGGTMLVWASDRSGEYVIYSKTLKAGVWSAETQITTGTGKESNPALLQSRNGILWLLWVRETFTGVLNRDIYYKTNTNGIWSPEVPLASTAAYETGPSIFEAEDGTVWVAYASSISGNEDVYYRTFNGVWSSEKPLTSNRDDDRQPWIMQALNGTVLMFWSRCVGSGPNCQDDIFYKTSNNLGVSWAAEVQFTFDPQGSEVFDIEPAAIHARNKKIYLFWASSIKGDGGDFDVFFSTSEIIPIHDVGLSAATVNPTNIQVGEVVTVDVRLTNRGDYSETVTISGFYENGTMTFFDSATRTIAPGVTTTLQLSWNTNGVTPANVPTSHYSIIIQVQPAPGESVRRQGDNTLDAGNVRVLPPVLPGDVDRDGDVDIIDAGALGIRFGATVGGADMDGDCDVDINDAAHLAIAFETVPGDPTYNALADIDGDGDIDIIDASLLGIRFGTQVGSEDVDGDCDVDIVDASILAIWFDTVV